MSCEHERQSLLAFLYWLCFCGPYALVKPTRAEQPNPLMAHIVDGKENCDCRPVDDSRKLNRKKRGKTVNLGSPIGEVALMVNRCLSPSCLSLCRGNMGGYGTHELSIWIIDAMKLVNMIPSEWLRLELSHLSRVNDVIEVLIIASINDGDTTFDDTIYSFRFNVVGPSLVTLSDLYWCHSDVDPPDAGTRWSEGRRISTRIKSKPLDWWRGEKMMYGRVHSSKLANTFWILFVTTVFVL